MADLARLIETTFPGLRDSWHSGPEPKYAFLLLPLQVWQVVEKLIGVKNALFGMPLPVGQIARLLMDTV
jgi:hypothetical protein